MLKRLHHHVRRVFHARYALTYAKARPIFILDSALVLIAVSLAGISLFFSFVRLPSLEPLTLALSIDEPRIISGQTTTFLVTYHNTIHQSLDNASLQVYFPREFFPVSLPPFATNTFNRQIIDLGILPPAAQATIPFTGVMWNSPGSQPKFFVTIRYTHAGKNYEQAAVYLAHSAQSVLQTRLVIPTTTASLGQLIPFTYTLYNTSEIPLTTRIHYAGTPLLNDFSLQSLPFQLEAHEQRIVTGSIQLADHTDLQTFTLTAAVKLPTGFIPQSRETATLTAAEPSFVSRLVFPTWPREVHLNQPLSLVVEWKNNSKILLQKAYLYLESKPELGHAMPKLVLGDLAPGAMGSSTFAITFSKEFFTATSSIILTPVVQALSNTLPISLLGESVSLPFAPDLTVEAEVRYYTPEGDQLGRGPLPPRVGEITKYWLILTAQPNAGTLTNPLLSLRLAPHVSFTGKYHTDGSETMLFTTSNTIATWQGTRALTTTTRWYVEVALTPQASENSTIPYLLAAGELSGKGEASHKSYLFPLPPRTNVLNPNDRGAAVGARIIP